MCCIFMEFDLKVPCYSHCKTITKYYIINYLNTVGEMRVGNNSAPFT